MGKKKTFKPYNHDAIDLEEATGENFDKVAKIALRMNEGDFDSASEVVEYVEKNLNRRQAAILAVKLHKMVVELTEEIFPEDIFKKLKGEIESGAVPMVGIAKEYENSNMPEEIKELLRRAESGDISAIEELRKSDKIDISVRKINREEAIKLGMDVDEIEKKAKIKRGVASLTDVKTGDA